MRFVIKDAENLARVFVLLGKMEKPYTIRVAKGVNRSHDQNNMYWSMLREVALYMSENTGRVITPEHVHECCRSMFAPTRDNGLGVKTPISTTEMTTVEFSDYYEECEAWAVSDLGVNLDAVR